MPRKTLEFDLDFIVKDIFPKFTVKQFDDVSFNIKPKNQGLNYDTTGMTGKIFVGVDNDMFMQTTGITVSSNNINVLLDKNMLQNRGRAYAEIELTDSHGTITSSSFIFNIDEKIGEGAKIPEGYEGFVAKYERLISEFKSQVNSTISNCNSNVNSAIKQCNASVDSKLNTVDSLVNAKISDLENRFNRLTSSQQQSAEVIDSRTDFKGQVFDSLKERIDYTDKILRESTVSTVETESDFTVVEQTNGGYFEDVKLEGKTLVNLKKGKSVSLLGSNYINYANETEKNRIRNGIFTVISCVDKDIGMELKKSDTLEYSRSVLIKAYSCNKIILNNEMWSNITGHISVWNEDNKQDLTNIIILEGDHTQNPPSFFEGLKSVGQDADEIVVSSVNENLFDNHGSLSDYYSFMLKSPQNSVYLNDKGHIVTTSSSRSYQGIGQKIKVEQDKTLYINFKSEGACRCNVFTSTGKRFIFDSTNSTFSSSFIPDSNEICVAFVGLGDIATCAFIDFQITRSDAKTYTPHEADEKQLLFYNTETQTWEKPVLREWDSIEKHSNGKYYYHKRSEEVVLNGSEDFYQSSQQPTNANLIRLYTNILNNKVAKGGFAISDKFINLTNIENESFTVDGAANVHFVISKSKLSSQDITGFKQWLSENNVTVVYQLAEEKVYECTNIDLITYANETNYIVESGAISPKSTLKVHNNISNVVSLLQKKVSILESDITNYMITQNRLQLASTYSADSVTFKVDYYAMYNNEAEEYNNDLYDLILNNILVGKDNYDYDKMFNIILDYASWNQISWGQFDILVGLMDIQHNPPIEETPTEEDVIEDEETPVE